MRNKFCLKPAAEAEIQGIKDYSYGVIYFKIQF